MTNKEYREELKRVRKEKAALKKQRQAELKAIVAKPEGMLSKLERRAVALQQQKEIRQQILGIQPQKEATAFDEQHERRKMQLKRSSKRYREKNKAQMLERTQKYRDAQKGRVTTIGFYLDTARANFLKGYLKEHDMTYAEFMSVIIDQLQLETAQAGETNEIL